MNKLSMNKLEQIKRFILTPYGFEVSATIYDAEIYAPCNIITHPSTQYTGLKWKYTPEYASATLPEIEEELSKVFGYDIFSNSSVNFINPYPSHNLVGKTGEKRIFTIEVGDISEEKVQEYIKELRQRMSNDGYKDIKIK